MYPNKLQHIYTMHTHTRACMTFLNTGHAVTQRVLLPAPS